jgi:parvulin-like peptidyl-prolyl isomerase
MKSSLISCLIFAIILAHGNIIAQTIGYDRGIARVGDKVISGSEFLERYELTPAVNKHNKKNTESEKTSFLYTLIAEKLWALEAAANGLDTTEVMKFSKNAFEKMFALDELYKREILDKIEITNEELLDAIEKNKTTLKVNYLFSEDEEEIRNLFKLLKDGIPFDTILAESPEYQEQPVPVEIVYGQMDKQIEDTLYALSLGEYTSPIFTPDGWYIFILKNKTEQLFSTAGDIQESENTAVKIIKARKEKEIFEKFYSDFFHGKSVDVNPVLFESLAQKISLSLSRKKTNENIKDGDPVFLLAGEVINIEEMFGEDSLKFPFILFDEKPLSLKEFIRIIAFDGFKLTDCSIANTRAQLDLTARQTIEKELLAREGFKRGYNLLPQVRYQVQMWYDNYLFQMLQNKFFDSLAVSDEEVYKYFLAVNERNNPVVMLNIVEVLTDSLELINSIMNELKNGTDIKELALKYTEREFTKQRGGEFGLSPVNKLGELGIIASRMEVGDIYGPLKLPEGYSVFQLIDKKRQDDSLFVPFEKVKDNYRFELMRNKLNTKMNDYTVQLALKYGIEINADFLRSIEVTGINSFAVRYLGFGGKMNAVPLLSPNSSWVESYLKKIKNIQ